MKEKSRSNHHDYERGAAICKATTKIPPVRAIMSTR